MKPKKNLTPKYLLIIIIMSLGIVYSCNTSKNTAVLQKEQPSDNYAVATTTSPIPASIKMGDINYHKSVNIQKDPSGRGNRTVVFVDTMIQKISKTIDITQLNPYLGLKYKVSSTNYQGNPVYTIDNKPLKEVLPNLNPSHYTDSTLSANITSLTSFHNVIEFNNYVIGVFEQRAFSNEIREATTSTIIVYDSLGSQICKLTDISTNVLDIEITKNGKYLALQYGINNEDGGMILGQGIRIYSTESNLQLIERNDGSGFFCKLNFIIFGTHEWINEQQFSTYEILDFENKLKYTRAFSPEEADIIDITENGYVIRNSDKTVTRLDFVKDFKIEKL